MIGPVHVPAQQPRTIPTKIAFVGEAPGEVEVDKGIPLVGPSGRVFNAALRAANLDRADYWVGNVFDEKLPDNDLKNWCDAASVPREAGRAEIAVPGFGYLKPEHHWHLERLASELKAVQPTVVVPLGGTALWALTGSMNIGQVRGNTMTATRLLPGTKLVPTLHPAFLLHSWKFLPVLIGDFIKAAAEAEEGPEVRHPPRELLIEPTIGDLMAWTPKLLASDLLSVDIETGWGQITCIGFAPTSGSAICVPFVDLRRPSRSYWLSPNEELTAWLWVEKILGSSVPKLGQNYGGYDAYWLLAKHGIRTMNMAEDTRLLHHALYPELPKSLSSLAGSYSRQGPWKQMRSAVEEKRDD